MPRVLVTGLSGFIGRRTLPFFSASRFEVVGVGRQTRPDWLDDTVQWISADLRDQAAIKPLFKTVAPSHCLHLAWDIEQGTYWRAPTNFLWVQLSLELLAAFVEAGGKRFVGGGTCAEYDWSYGYLSEDLTPRNPRTPFGRCKNALFEALMAYSDMTGLSAAWARIFFLYGPGEAQARLFPQVILNLLAGQAARTSSGTQVRDFMYVDDVAAALVALVDSDISGGVNVGSGEPLAVRAIVEKVGAMLGRPNLLEIGARPQQEGEPPLLVANVRRLKDELGFAPRYNLDTGLAAMIEHCRSLVR
jgi:nucleoside-diphosphate-sugar epimerase